MNILLLGGTGAMGAHLTEILAHEGNTIYVTSRRERKNKDGITYVKGNAHDMDFLNPVLKSRRWDAIVDFMIYTTQEFKEKADIFLLSTKQYVYLSSSRVYADSKEHITENSPRLLDVCNDEDYLKTDEYALTKARQENILFSSGYTNWTIIRPYITFSETRLQLSPVEKEGWLYRALQGKSIFFSSDLADKYTTLTYGYDVARGIAAIVGNEKAYSEAFHITVAENHKWSEILDLYLDVINRCTGKRPKVVMLENWEPLIGGGAMQVKWDRLCNRRFDNSKINKFIDTHMFKSTTQALEDCLIDFIGHPKYDAINWYNEARRDRRERKWSRIGNMKSVRTKIAYILIRLGLKS